MEMSERKQKILKAIVDLYIRTAEPVGSKTIAAMPDMDVLYITHVHKVVEDADTFFPDIDTTVFRTIDQSPLLFDEQSQLHYTFITYQR